MAELDTLVFATDRKAQIEVRVGGQLLGAGIGVDGNLVSVDVAFDIDSMPPTASLAMQVIPAWIKRKMSVEINAGYNSNLTRIFTGRVKRRRHGVDVQTLECVGRTGKLTQPFTSNGMEFLSIGAADAIIEILSASGVDFSQIQGEQYQIDPAVNTWVMATVQKAVLDLATASDMIRQIADVDGNRCFESRAGTLTIIPLLEAPAPSPFHTYGTVGAGANVDATVAFGDGPTIDAADAFGDDLAREQRSQGWKPTVDGAVAVVGFWLKKVGNPTDSISFSLYDDVSANTPFQTGWPGTTLLGSSAPMNGQLLSTTDWTPVTLRILSGTELVAGKQYHVVVHRSGDMDASNYYLVGRVSAGGYANGAPGVKSGGSWTSGEAGDYVFTTVTTTFSALRLLNIADDEDEDQVKKQVIVTGAALESSDIEGNVTQTQVYGERHVVGDDLVAGDYHFFSASYQNGLIQDDAKAVQVAQRLLDKFYRVLQSIEIEVPFDPRMDLGTTLGINDPRVTKLHGNWWVRAYRHTLAENTAVTQISLFGGDQSGTVGCSEPRPDFTVTPERELVGGAVQAVLLLDASASAAPSGKIVTYHWTDDYAPNPMDISGPDLVKIVRAYDPALQTPVNITLAITDDSVCDPPLFED